MPGRRGSWHNVGDVGRVVLSRSKQTVGATVQYVTGAVGAGQRNVDRFRHPWLEGWGKTLDSHVDFVHDELKDTAARCTTVSRTYVRELIDLLFDSKHSRICENDAACRRQIARVQKMFLFRRINGNTRENPPRHGAGGMGGAGGAGGAGGGGGGGEGGGAVHVGEGGSGDGGTWESPAPPPTGETGMGMGLRGRRLFAPPPKTPKTPGLSSVPEGKVSREAGDAAAANAARDAATTAAAAAAEEEESIRCRRAVSHAELILMAKASIAKLTLLYRALIDLTSLLVEYVDYWDHVAPSRFFLMSIPFSWREPSVHHKLKHLRTYQVAYLGMLGRVGSLLAQLASLRRVFHQTQQTTGAALPTTTGRPTGGHHARSKHYPTREGREGREPAEVLLATVVYKTTKFLATVLLFASDEGNTGGVGGVGGVGGGVGGGGAGAGSVPASIFPERYMAPSGASTDSLDMSVVTDVVSGSLVALDDLCHGSEHQAANFAAAMTHFERRFHGYIDPYRRPRLWQRRWFECCVVGGLALYGT